MIKDTSGIDNLFTQDLCMFKRTFKLQDAGSVLKISFIWKGKLLIAIVDKTSLNILNIVGDNLNSDATETISRLLTNEIRKRR